MNIFPEVYIVDKDKTFIYNLFFPLLLAPFTGFSGHVHRLLTMASLSFVTQEIFLQVRNPRTALNNLYEVPAMTENKLNNLF